MMSIARKVAMPTGLARTVEGRKKQIMDRRGCFKWLPIAFSNDIVHGSWFVGFIVLLLITIHCRRVLIVLLFRDMEMQVVCHWEFLGCSSPAGSTRGCVLPFL